jgi:hypothetical protein
MEKDEEMSSAAMSDKSMVAKVAAKLTEEF